MAPPKKIARGAARPTLSTQNGAVSLRDCPTHLLLTSQHKNIAYRGDTCQPFARTAKRERSEEAYCATRETGSLHTDNNGDSDRCRRLPGLGTPYTRTRYTRLLHPGVGHTPSLYMAFFGRSAHLSTGWERT